MSFVKSGIAEAFVTIRANTDDYKKSLSGIKGSLSNLTKTTNFQLGLMTAGITTAALAARKAFQFIGESIKLGSEANETKNRFKVVFSDIVDEAEKASKDIAQEFKLADATAKTIISSTGDLLTGFGFTQEAALELSKRVARLGGDLASFQDEGRSAEEAASLLTKGMLGQTRALFGLKIAFSQKSPEFRKMVAEEMKATGATYAMARANSVLKEAERQSVNAIGDFQRTLKEFANQLRVTKESIKGFKIVTGAMFIDLIEASNVLPAFNDDLAEFQDNLEIIANSDFWKSTQKAVTATFTGLRVAWLAMKTTFDMVGTAIGTALADPRQVFEATVDSVMKNVDKMEKAMNDAADSYERIDAQAQRKFMKGQREEQDAIKETMKLRTGSADQLRRLFQEGALGKTVAFTGVPMGMGAAERSGVVEEAVTSNAETSKDILAAINRTNNILSMQEAMPVIV